MKVSWLAGWYATRLHAIVEGKEDDFKAGGASLCGAWVYTKARSEWAQRRINKGLPKCKHCLRILESKKEGEDEQ